MAADGVIRRESVVEAVPDWVQVGDCVYVEKPPALIKGTERLETKCYPTLYQVTLALRGHEQLLAYDDGRPYRAKNLQNVREMLASMPVNSITMRHESAYDEMVGQPARQASNAMEIGLAPLDRVDPTVH